GRKACGGGAGFPQDACRNRRCRRGARPLFRYGSGLNRNQSMEETPFELPAAERSLYEPALMVDVDGFEGPLDLLLALARNQQVDLTRISILALADQYLAFIGQARELKIEVAADY